jgi:lipopolysaccharide/colanic/teichoic acid biosynthesis glycosyltransferase
MNLRFDFVLLGALAGPAVLGVYAVASKFAELMRLVPTAVNYVLYPRFARLGKAKATAEARRLLPLNTALTVAMTPFLAAATLVALPILYGQAYRGAITPAEIIIVGLSVEGAAAVASAYLVGIGRPGLNSVGMGVGTIITVTLDVILIPRYGAIGGAITSAVTYLTTTMVLVIVARSQFRAQARADRLGPLARPEIRADSWMRRAVDLIVSAVALAIWGPVIVALAAAVRLTSRGPAFYRQVRIGRSREPFTILKLRSMVTGADRADPLVTSHADPRVTRLGAVLRATKLDELPQLVNVLKGDMTLIGPRPEVPRYIPCYSGGELETLNVRPGLTGAGQIFYTQMQQAPVSGAEGPEQHYITHELPAKLGFDLDYLRRRSLGYDLTLVLRTILLVTGLGKRVPAPAPAQDVPTIVTAPGVRGRSGDDTLPFPLIRDSATTEAAEPLKEGWFTPHRARDHDGLR